MPLSIQHAVHAKFLLQILRSVFEGTLYTALSCSFKPFFIVLWPAELKYKSLTRFQMNPLPQFIQLHHG